MVNLKIDYPLKTLELLGIGFGFYTVRHNVYTDYSKNHYLRRSPLLFLLTDMDMWPHKLLNLIGYTLVLHLVHNQEDHYLE